MFLSRLLLRRNGDDTQDQGSCVLIIFVVVIVATILVKIVQWVLPEPTVPLLPSADGMIQATSITEAQTHTETPLLVPQDLLGSSVTVVGLYPNGGEYIPPASAAIVLARDGWRFVEIFETPGMTREQALLAYGENTSEDILLAKGITGTLVQTPRWYLQCVEGYEGLPGVCQITKALVFEINGTTITISADGTHATDGELILLAQDLLAQSVEEVQE